MKRWQRLLQIEAEAIRKLSRLEIEKAADYLNGYVCVTGVGKSGIAGKKISATFRSLGKPSVFLHPVEALHGDMGILQEGDSILAISNSGETEELLRFIETLHSPVVSITRKGSRLAQLSRVFLDASVEDEGSPIGAPLASTIAAIAAGDALAVELAHRKGWKANDYRRVHPGGSPQR